MNRLLRSLCALGLLLLPAIAQDQATTLAAASRRAVAVVVATVVAATDPSPEWHRLELRTDELLAGQLGAQFTLLEPAGACCGRSLFAMQVGDRCLLFLERNGPALHPFGGSRGVLPLAPGLVAHVRALLAAGDDAARARVLAQALQHDHARIAADAAHALAALPTLALGSNDCEAVATALADAVQRGRATTPSLVEVAVRLQGATMLDRVLPLYLDAPRSDQAAALRAGLARCRSELLAERLPSHLHGDERRQLRAAELLAELPAEAGAVALRALLRTAASPRVQLCVVESLLDAGTAANTLQAVVPAPVLHLAERRLAAARTFRSIDPARR